VKITAPIDGVVLSGDLERARGVPVQRGQVLFELAPLAEMTLEVAVPDADAMLVGKGQKGEFALQASPERTMDFVVDRVRPQAEVRSDKNVFVTEAPVTNAVGWLRPGMQGTAKIDVSRKRLGWVLTRRLVNWFRLTFWW
jgi:multidrug efflux pump subunit AcrA (membrane-fusion protein)